MKCSELEVLRGYGVVRIVRVDVQVARDGDRSQDGERSSEPSSWMLSGGQR